MKKWIYIALLFFAMSSQALAQSIQIQLSAEKVEVGEGFIISFTTEGGVDDLTLPEMKGFQVHSSGKSTSVSIINGDVKKSVTHTVTAIGLKAGVYTIPPAKGKYKGKIVQSSPFRIEVVESVQTANPGNNTSSAPNRSSSETVDYPQGHWKNNILLVAEADKKQAYVGEQITITYTLYRKIDYRNLEVNQIPVYKGFLSEEMELPDHQTEGVKVYNGSKFYYQSFRKVALFAPQPGKYTIDPITLRGVILIPEEDPFFGTGFFNITEPKSVQIISNKLQVEVIPLPLSGKPGNFSGVVGNYEVSKSAAPNAIAAGEALNIVLQIKGNGNLRAVSPPAIPAPESFDKYEPEVIDDFQKSGDKFGGSRTFKYTFVPQREGKIILPEFEYNWFDPNLGTYQKATFSASEIEVMPGNYVENNSENEPQGKINIGQKNGFGEVRSSSTLPLILGGTLPILGLLGLFFFHRKKKKTAPVEKELPAEWPDFSGKDEKEDYIKLSNSLKEKLCQRLHLPQDSSLPAILPLLADEMLRERIQLIFSSCERAAFSPLPASSIEHLWAESKSCLEAIDHLINPSA